MGDSFIPPALYSGGWISSFEQVTTIHFNHRMLAYFTGITLVVLALRTWLADSDARLRRAGMLLLGAITLQIVLGISTVLSHVDVAIAAGHQSGAVVLLTTVLFWAHCHRTTFRT